MTHRAWLVDFDGTLYRPTPVKAMMALELLTCGWRAVPLLRQFRREHERIRTEQTESELNPFDLQVARTAQQIGVTEDRVRRTVNSWMIERPKKWVKLAARGSLLKELNDFATGGGKLALVSDYPARQKLTALGNRITFDAVISSGEPDGPKRLKPDPDGYLRAANTLGVKPEECLVIGDRVDADGLAAERAGMDFRHIE